MAEKRSFSQIFLVAFLIYTLVRGGLPAEMRHKKP